MFFYLSKILWVFMQPSLLLVILNLVCVILLLRQPCRRRRNACLGAMGLFLCFSLFPVGNNLFVTLENRFPPLAVKSLNPDGIIVLSGAEDTLLTQHRQQLSLNEGAERLLGFALLAHEFPNAELVFTGSTGALLGSSVTADQIAEQVTQTLGIPSDRIRFERRARNTYENARLSFELVQPTANQRWVLITSASHMPRAVGAFRSQDWDVIPFPVDYKTVGSYRWLPSPAVGYNLARLDRATHEWVGLLAYWLTGKTSAFFPLPKEPSS